MATIEIRQSKKKLIPMLALLTAALFGTTYYAFFSGNFDNIKAMKVLYVILLASLAYAIYIPAKKFFKHEPVLTVSKSEIEMNEKGKPTALLWLQVIDWKIEKDDSTYYLIVETADKKHTINISWLEKTPSEIEALLQTYKKTA